MGKGGKWLAFTSVALIVLVVIIFFMILVEKSPDCKTTQTGWECKLTKSQEAAKKRECDKQNGLFGPSYGYIVSWEGKEVTNTFHCYHPYLDGWEKCNDSKECTGDCVVPEQYLIYKLPEKIATGLIKPLRPRDRILETPCPDCIGNCEKYPKSSCAKDYILDDGMVKIVGTLCY